MSRIGKLPVSLPTGVSAELLPGNVVKVKGPHGEMSQKVDPAITVTIEDNQIKFARPTDLPVIVRCTDSTVPSCTTW